MEFVKVIDTTELPENTMVKVLAGGNEILLANVQGSYYAIAHKCTHLGGSLSNGTLNTASIYIHLHIPPCHIEPKIVSWPIYGNA